MFSSLAQCKLNEKPLHRNYLMRCVQRSAHIHSRSERKRERRKEKWTVPHAHWLLICCLATNGAMMRDNMKNEPKKKKLRSFFFILFCLISFCFNDHLVASTMAYCEKKKKRFICLVEHFMFIAVHQPFGLFVVSHVFSQFICFIFFPSARLNVYLVGIRISLWSHFIFRFSHIHFHHHFQHNSFSFRWIFLSFFLFSDFLCVHRTRIGEKCSFFFGLLLFRIVSSKCD